MSDFLNFKKMMIPLIIRFIFWAGVGLSVISGIVLIFGGASGMGGMGVLLGLATIAFGPFVIRIYCEMLIVVFMINDSLTELVNLQKGRTSS